MHRRKDRYDEAWFDRLDAIITGKGSPTTEDDDVLHVAAKLSDALAPLGNLNADRENRRLLREHVQSGKGAVSPLAVEANSRGMLLRKLLLVAVVLFVLFGIGGTCATSPQVSAATLRAGLQVWQAATSFEQINASSVALLSLKKAGVRPLLPVAVPAGTQSIEFGMIVDTTEPLAFTAFVADYRIDGQDISVYERTVDMVFPSSVAQAVDIGSIKAQLFQDDKGNRILQWYQDGMTCQVASTLPASELIAIAQQFRPISSWELIL